MDKSQLVEAKSSMDDAWYEATISLENDRIRVTFTGFDGEDEFITISKDISRLRFPSSQLQDEACSTDVNQGDTVCAFSEVGSASMYWDAQLVKIRKKPHKIKKKGDETCNCDFVIRWLEGELKGDVTVADCGQICLIDQRDVVAHPVIADFLEICSTKGEQQQKNGADSQKSKKRKLRVTSDSEMEDGDASGQDSQISKDRIKGGKHKGSTKGDASGRFGAVGGPLIQEETTEGEKPARKSSSAKSPAPGASRDSKDCRGKKNGTAPLLAVGEGIGGEKGRKEAEGASPLTRGAEGGRSGSQEEQPVPKAKVVAAAAKPKAGSADTLKRVGKETGREELAAAAGAGSPGAAAEGMNLEDVEEVCTTEVEAGRVEQVRGGSMSPQGAEAAEEQGRDAGPGPGSVGSGKLDGGHKSSRRPGDVAASVADGEHAPPDPLSTSLVAAAAGAGVGVGAAAAAAGAGAAGESSSLPARTPSSASLPPLGRVHSKCLLLVDNVEDACDSQCVRETFKRIVGAGVLSARVIVRHPNTSTANWAVVIFQSPELVATALHAFNSPSVLVASKTSRPWVVRPIDSADLMWNLSPISSDPTINPGAHAPAVNALLPVVILKPNSAQGQAAKRLQALFRSQDEERRAMTLRHAEEEAQLLGQLQQKYELL